MFFRPQGSCCKIKESRRTIWQAHGVEHVFVISVRNKRYDILAAINTSAAENSTRDCLIKTVAMYVSWFVGLVKAHFYVPYLRFHINCEVTTICTAIPREYLQLSGSLW